MTISAWERFFHSITGWSTYVLPNAERVEVPKARSRVEDSVEFDWPAAFRPLVHRAGKAWTTDSKGVGPGTPMQNGTTATRSLTWGWAEYGERNSTIIPRPASGWYWTTGYPSPYHDRHCIVAAPDGSVHEMIQLDPTAPTRQLPFPNQALGWSRWVDGVCVQGRPSSATGYAIHQYSWTPWSAEAPHEQRLVLHDYVGADGALTVGPAAGSRWHLAPGSASHTRNLALGGDCAARAQALVDYGCVLQDRSGYLDASVESRKVGTKPLPPALSIQPGRQWKGTNAHLFTFDVADLRLVTR